MAALRFFLSLLMIPISILVCGAALLAFSAAWVSPVHSGLIAYAGLVMPIILVVNLLLGIYWAIKKKGWILFPVIALLINMGYLTSIFQITFSKPKVNPEKTTLQIATYNVGNFHSWGNFSTQPQITDYFKKNNVNIVCFQEFSESQHIKADSLGKLLNLPYHTSAHLLGSRSFETVIFSQYPILNSGQLPFKSPTNDAIWADLQINDQTVRIVSCHLETTSFNSKRRKLQKQSMENMAPNQLYSIYNDISSTLLEKSRIRATQAEMIRELIDTSSFPVIVCGDFNDPPSTYTYHCAKGNLRDSFQSRGNGFGYTFRGMRRLLRIDYILYDPRFKCIAYNSEEKTWSDHNPIICKFHL